MKTDLTRWFSIVLLLILVMLNYTIRARGTSKVPCRPVPEVCAPEIQPLPCQPSLCPDADTSEIPRSSNR